MKIIPKLTLLPTAILRVNPEPSTNASPRRTWRHPGGHLEVCETMEDTSLVNAENGEVLRLNLSHIRLVRDGQRTTFEIIRSICMILARWASRTRVVAAAYISALRRREERSSAFIACNLCDSSLTCRKLKEVAGTTRMSKYYLPKRSRSNSLWWVIQMDMKPPLIKGHIRKRGDRAIVIRVRLLSYIETPHARVKDS